MALSFSPPMTLRNKDGKIPLRLVPLLFAQSANTPDRDIGPHLRKRHGHRRVNSPVNSAWNVGTRPKERVDTYTKVALTQPRVQYLCLANHPFARRNNPPPNTTARWFEVNMSPCMVSGHFKPIPRSTSVFGNGICDWPLYTPRLSPVTVEITAPVVFSMTRRCRAPGGSGIMSYPANRYPSARVLNTRAWGSKPQ